MRGFALLSPERRREIAAMGAKASRGKGHRWTSETARIAGAKGGKISHGGRGREWKKA